MRRKLTPEKYKILDIIFSSYKLGLQYGFDDEDKAILNLKNGFGIKTPEFKKILKRHGIYLYEVKEYLKQFREFLEL